MATDFKVRRGLASELFVDPSASVLKKEINPNLRVEVGCWYLTSDTAELFLGVTLDDGTKSLKRINSEGTEALIAEIQKEIAGIGIKPLYKQIDDEYSLPTDKDIESSDFDSNLVYYIIHKDGSGKLLNTCSTYIFDAGTQSYLCANSVDMAAIYSNIDEAINIRLTDKFSALLPDMIRTEIKNTFADGLILFGGTA